MTSLLVSLELNTDTGAFDASLDGEIGKLIEVARLAAELKDNPSGVTEFIAKLAALAGPALSNGADVELGIDEARTALTGVTGNAAPGALDDLARFATLVSEELVPLMDRTLKAARAIEGIAKAQFVCPEDTPDPLIPMGSEPPPPSGASRAAVALDRATDISARVDQLPDPLTPGALIDFIVGFALNPTSASIFPMPLPLLDDTLLPLQTLGRWSLANPADIGIELETTLTTLRDRLVLAGDGTLDTRVAAASNLETALRASDLESFTTDYMTTATAMAVALETNDPAEAASQAAALDTHIAAFETIRGSQGSDFTPLVPAVSAELGELALAIHDRLSHLAAQLEPLDPGRFFQAFDLPTAADAEAQQEIQDHLAPITNFLEDLTEKLNLSSVEGDVATVATQAQGIADDISGALATLAQQTRTAFAEVETAVQSLPLDDLANDIRAGITDIGNRIEADIRSAFTPLRDALAQAIQAISDALATFDAQTITDAVTDAVAQITSVLQDPTVVSAAEEIRNVLDQTAQAAGNLSFAPVTDEVVKLIEQMESGLRALDETELNDALLGLLDAALAILPNDLRPVTTPLIDELGIKIEQGPVVLLEEIREKPQQVVDTIRGFDPGAVITQKLGAPFDQAFDALRAVQIGTVVTTLDTAFTAEKARLKAAASPSMALAPVVTAFNTLLTEFDALSPDTLLAPIEDQIETAIQNVIDAAPIDEIFDEVNAVFDTIQAVLDTVDAIEEALSKSATRLQALQNPDADIDSWRDAALAKVDSVPNAAALDTLLGDIASAIDATQRSALLARFDAATASILAALDTVDAEAALAQMIVLRQRILPLVNALPAGPERTTIETVLARFDPLDPTHSNSLSAAARLRNAVLSARTTLDTMAADFEDALHGSDGLLTGLKNGAADASLLRTAVEADIETALVPVRYVAAQLGAAAVPTGAVAAGFADLSGKLTGAIGDILTGPASLQTIANAVQQVVDTIRDIDLAFLRDSLEGVFQSVRGEIEAAGPEPLIIALDKEFNDIIDAINLSLVIPQPDIAALDQQIAAIITTLETLNPGRLIGNSVQEAYEQDVVPLVEALDITPVFDALIETLRGLEQDLENEMARINTAYGRLLSARPGGGGGTVSLSVGVG